MEKMLNPILTSLGSFVPQLAGAVVLLILNIVIATVVRGVVTKLTKTAGIDERLNSPGISKTLAQAAYWLVWLLGLPSLLGALGLTAMLEPVNNLVSQLLGFVPKLLGAGVILAVGFMIANIVKELVTATLTAAGSEKLTERLNLGDSLGKGGLAGLLGNFLFLLILLPILAGALEPIGLTAVTRVVTGLLETITNLLPKIIGASIILVFAVVIGRLVANLVAAALAGMQFNRLPAILGFGENMRPGGNLPSKMVGDLVMFGIVLTASTQASEVLGVGILTAVIASIGGFVAQALSALVIVLAGLWISNLAASALKTSSSLASLARVAILFFTAPMALYQLGLPSQIIILGFGSVVGAVAVAAAIAFGIGGQDVARKALQNIQNPSNSKLE